MATATKAGNVRPELPGSLDLRFSAAEKHFASKVTLTRAEFDALKAEAQVFAFTVARIQSIKLIADIQEEVQKAIVEGTTLKDFQDAMPGLMAKHGWSGSTPWHIETVFRTNTQMAYGLGQYEALQELAEAFPFWRYVAIHDARTRPSHMALNGRIYPANHPFWRIHFPPWGYNCRCDVIAMLPEEVGDDDIVWTDDGPPQENGFNGPGNAVFTLKTLDPKRIATSMMPRALSPVQQAQLMDKLADGPTLEEIDAAYAENAEKDKAAKLAKRQAQIKAAQAKYAAKKKAEKAAAIAAKKAADEAAQLAAVVDKAHDEAIAMNKAIDAAKKAEKIAEFKVKYPNIAKAADDTAIEKYYLKQPDDALAKSEIEHKKFFVEEFKKKYPHVGKSGGDIDKLMTFPAADLALMEKMLAKEAAERAAALAAAKAEAEAAAKKAQEAIEAAEALKKKTTGLDADEKAARRAEQIRKARATYAAKKKAERAGGVVPVVKPDASDPLTRLSKLDYAAGNVAGVDIPRDTTLIEGNNLNVRLVTDKNGVRHYEFYGKFTDDEIAAWANKQRDFSDGGSRVHWGTKPGIEHIEGSAEMSPTFRSTPSYALGGDRVRYTPFGGLRGEIRIDSRKWADAHAQNDRGVDTGAATLINSFRIRVPRSGNDSIDYDRFKTMVTGTPLEALLKQPTAADMQKAGLIRALTHEKPGMLMPKGESFSVGPHGSQIIAKLPTAIAQKLDPGSVSRGVIGVSAKDLQKLSLDELEEIGNSWGMGLKREQVKVREFKELGYSTQVRKRKIDYETVRVFHGTGSAPASAVAEIIADGRLTSSYHRIRYGTNGVLNGADMNTGGADSIFTRIITKSQVGHQLNQSYAGGTYQFVFKADVLDRLDAYAYNGDNYGRAYGATIKNRMPIEKLVEKNRMAFNRNNEVMFRRGLTFDSLQEIVAPDGPKREALLEALRLKGITHIKGRRIEDIVVVRRHSRIDSSFFGEN